MVSAAKRRKKENVSEPIPKITWKDKETKSITFLGGCHCNIWNYLLLSAIGRLDYGI